MPDASTSGPRTLSSFAILCFASGRIALFSIFLPRFAQARKSYDISKLLSIGPTAWDASEENGMAICVGDRVVGLLTMITALVSAWPNGFCPLNMKFARPSQKFRWLNTALIVVGVLRGSTACGLIVEYGRVLVGRVAEAMERVVGRHHCVVEVVRHERGNRRSGIGPWVQRVLNAVVCPRMEMARCASLYTITPHLHVPEEG